MKAKFERVVNQDLLGLYISYKSSICRPVLKTKFKVGDLVEPEKVPATFMVKMLGDEFEENWIRTHHSYPTKNMEDLADSRDRYTEFCSLFNKKINIRSPESKKLKEVLDYITESVGILFYHMGPSRVVEGTLEYEIVQLGFVSRESPSLMEFISRYSQAKEVTKKAVALHFIGESSDKVAQLLKIDDSLNKIKQTSFRAGNEFSEEIARRCIFKAMKLAVNIIDSSETIVVSAE